MPLAAGRTGDAGGGRACEHARPGSLDPSRSVLRPLRTVSEARLTFWCSTTERHAPWGTWRESNPRFRIVTLDVEPRWGIAARTRLRRPWEGNAARVGAPRLQRPGTTASPGRIELPFPG